MTERYTDLSTFGDIKTDDTFKTDPFSDFRLGVLTNPDQNKGVGLPQDELANGRNRDRTDESLNGSLTISKLDWGSNGLATQLNRESLVQETTSTTGPKSDSTASSQIDSSSFIQAFTRAAGTTGASQVFTAEGWSKLGRAIQKIRGVSPKLEE